MRFASVQQLAFDRLNTLAQPSAQSLFCLHATPEPVEGIHRDAVRREMNKAAGDLLGVEVRRDKMHQPAILASLLPRSVRIIWAARGFLKYVRGAPRHSGTTPVATLFQKFQLLPEQFQNSLRVVLHFRTRILSRCINHRRCATEGDRSVITRCCD